MNNDTTPKSTERTSKIHLLPFGAALAIGLAAVLSTLIAAGTWKEVRKAPDKNNIRITGSARKRIVSDLIQWSATIEARGPDRTAAATHSWGHVFVPTDLRPWPQTDPQDCHPAAWRGIPQSIAPPEIRCES